MKNDADLKQDVLVRLEFDPLLDVSGLAISVKSGVVTLEGKLRDGEERTAAERAIKLVPGVKGVVDRVRIEQPEGKAPSDSEIAVSVSDAIQWLTTVPVESIAVRVRDGWVTLNGAVDSWHLRATLEDVVRHLPQSKGVDNLIKVRVEANRQTRKEIASAV